MSAFTTGDGSSTGIFVSAPDIMPMPGFVADPVIDPFIYSGEPNPPLGGTLWPSIGLDPLFLPGGCSVGGIDPITGDTIAGCGNGTDVPPVQQSTSGPPAWLASLGQLFGGFARGYTAPAPAAAGGNRVSPPPAQGIAGIPWLLWLLIALLVILALRKK